MTAKTAGEWMNEARGLSREISVSSPVKPDDLRGQAKALFDQLPEEPSYLRANDPTPSIAANQIPQAVQFLAKLYALGPDSPSSKDANLETAFRYGALTEEKKAALSRELALLTMASEAHLRALSAMANGELIEGDLACDALRKKARIALLEGAKFRRLYEDGTRPVYDSAKDASRYDPDGRKIAIQVTCPNCHQLNQFTVSACEARHMFVCRHCRKNLHAIVGYMMTLRRHYHGIKSHYFMGIDLLGEPRRLLEFDVHSQREFTASPNDLIALVYSQAKALTALENLTTGALFLVRD